jgi:hypothetical protein
MALLTGTSTFKNFLICGDFETNPWSLGTSLSDAGYYGVNRWDLNRWSCWRSGAAAGLTLTKASISPGSGPTSRMACRLQRASGNSSTASCVIQQSIESLYSPMFRNNWVTFSFWARAGAGLTSSGNAVISQVATGTGTDQATTIAWNGAVNYFKTFNLTTTWTKYSHTVFIPGTTNQLCPGVYFDPTGTAGASDYAEFALFQLELGQQASDFEHISQERVLLLSQRFYEKTNFIPGINSYTGYVEYQSQNNIPAYTQGTLSHSTQFTVRKRAIPTTRVYGFGYLANTVMNQNINGGTARTGATVQDINTNGFGYILLNNTGTININLYEVIGYHWDARAEI